MPIAKAILRKVMLPEVVPYASKVLYCSRNSTTLDLYHSRGKIVKDIYSASIVK